MSEQTLKEDQEKEELNEFFISELTDYIKVLRSNKDYSVQRLDILTITICGAGIYTSFELMKYINDSKLLTLEQTKHLNIHFKITGLLFTLAIIVNLISQWTAYKSTSFSIESTKMAVHSAKKFKIDRKKMMQYQRKSTCYNLVTGKANITSILLMILALIMTMLFTWILF